MSRLLPALAVLLFALPAFADDPKPFPKPLKDGEKVKAGGWVGKQVLPKRLEKDIRMGEWVDGKQVTWVPQNLLNCVVREDRDGFVRVADLRREGWVSKDDMVTADDAPAWWDNVVKERPDEANGWQMRGLGWLYKGEFDHAVKDFTELLRLLPDSGAAYNNRAMAWQGKGEHDKAVADYTAAMKLNPTDASSVYNRGIVWQTMKEYDKAIADYSAAIKLDPQDAVKYSVRAAIWQAKKEYAKAIADFAEAIRLAPTDAACYSARGALWHAKKEYAKAIADHELALKFDPASASALNNLAWVLATCPEKKYRDGKKAVGHAKRQVEVNAAWWGSYDTLAAAYAETGEFELAVADQRKAVEMLKADKSADKDELKKAEARLELYRAKKPYRDEE